MVDIPETPVLAQLRAIRADLTEVQGSLSEIEDRSTNVEGGLASVLPQLGHLARASASKQIAVDRMTDQVTRIERQLDLCDA